jgi:hypothetical protein
MQCLLELDIAPLDPKRDACSIRLLRPLVAQIGQTYPGYRTTVDAADDVVDLKTGCFGSSSIDDINRAFTS